MNKRSHMVPFGADFVQKKPLRDFREEETKMEISDPSDLARYITDQATIDNLKSNGILSLFPIQQATFNVIVKGNDLTARDRTGSGKTLAYALPALERMRRGKLLTGSCAKILVIVPTR